MQSNKLRQLGFTAVCGFTTAVLFIVVGPSQAIADSPHGESITLWSEFAPGETTRHPGTARPAAPKQAAGITRIENITQPTLDAFPADKPNGSAIVILPGGGFGYVVTDLEGSEAAPFLNKLGISVFVLRYRTGDNSQPDVWREPVQDAQRAIRMLRADAARWSIDPKRIGVLGFSAGGQATAFLATAKAPLYESVDSIDEQDWKPNFSILVYPWRLLDDQGKLKAGIQVDESTPKTILIHTHDDQSADSLGSVLFYSELKKHRIDAELHIYRSGGHGYGLRKKEGSTIDQWPSLVSDWLLTATPQE